MRPSPDDEIAARQKNRGLPFDVHFLKVGGPLVTKHMRQFVAKLGMALHYDLHGERVPNEGGVQPIWFSNLQAASGALPSELIGLLPAPKTLKQGRKEVSEQFTYSSVTTEEKQHSFCYAVFRASFAAGAATAMDRREFLEQNNDKYPIIKPGDFKT